LINKSVRDIIHVVNISVQSRTPCVNVKLGDRVEEKNSIESNSTHLFDVISFVGEVLSFIGNVEIDSFVLIAQKRVELRLSVNLRVFKIIFRVPVEEHFVVYLLFLSTVLVSVVAILRQSIGLNSDVNLVEQLKASHAQNSVPLAKASAGIVKSTTLVWIWVSVDINTDLARNSYRVSLVQVHDIVLFWVSQIASVVKESSEVSAIVKRLAPLVLIGNGFG